MAVANGVEPSWDLLPAERTPVDRRLPVGAEVVPGGVSFRVWAPERARVVVHLSSFDGAHEVALEKEADGYFSGVAPGARAGDLYRFQLDDDETLYPDPASRFQPEGPHGPSQVIDDDAYTWNDAGWLGVGHYGQAIYELHVGTFTPEGTWRAAMERLPHLADLGISIIELMPVADFCGTFGWGYDGVNLFAPTRLYGTPDDFRRFVDRAHALHLGVVLDVVYNHLGPDGNYLAKFSADYFTDRHKTDWGAAINYDGPNCGPVREFMIANARYWIEEFHLDGLRFDATQDIHDDSEDHILAVQARTAREAAGARSIFLVSENEPQQIRYVRPPEEGGFGFDALWNDDLHHTAIVALTGRSEAYYTDYKGTPQEFISALKHGYLYQGQWYKWQKQRRGTASLGTDPSCFVTFLQNHDQVANSGLGQRPNINSPPGQWRALTALILLGPGTPMLLQGQEFGATTPFLYFAEHNAELAPLVHRGRKQFLSQFPSLASTEVQEIVPDPADRATFERSKLDWDELTRRPEAWRLHRDLLRLRYADDVLAEGLTTMDGAVLGPSAFVLRFFGEVDDRLLVVNLGQDLDLSPAPEPLLAEPEGRVWEVALSTEDPRYGGGGTPPVNDQGKWFLPAHSAVFFQTADKQRV